MRCASGARLRVSLSGLPGVTSHHTRSSLSRFMASRQAPRCAWCGGSNVPPNKPIRMPGACGGSTTRDINAPGPNPSRSDLPRAVNTILESAELLDPDRTARMHASGCDADLGAKPELAAVGELRRRV